MNQETQDILTLHKSRLNESLDIYQYNPEQENSNIDESSLWLPLFPDKKGKK